MKKKVFITGAAGFIGFHLGLKLKALGCDVCGYDNFNDYYDVSLKRARAEKLAAEGIPVLQGDVCDEKLLIEQIEKYDPTHFVHLAAQAGVRYSLENPHAYLQSNVTGFLNVLEVCRRSPSLPLVYASSSSVYGLNAKIPFSVHDRTDEQASLYGVTKKTNELMAATYRHLFSIQAVGLRFFTVYGPWGRPDMAYYSFTKNILAGIPIPIFNGGKMRRDFTYIDDIVNGIVSAIDYQGKTEIFNLGNHKAVELEAMIAMLEKHLGKKAKKEYLPHQPGDVLETYADIDQSRLELNYEPATSLDEGLSRFVSWYLETQFQ